MRIDIIVNRNSTKMKISASECDQVISFDAQGSAENSEDISKALINAGRFLGSEVIGGAVGFIDPIDA